MNMIVACGQFAPGPGEMKRMASASTRRPGRPRLEARRSWCSPSCASAAIPRRGGPARAVAAGGAEIGRLGESARANGIALCFGFAERADDGRLFNSMACVTGNGAPLAVYRKVHLWITEKAWAVPGHRVSPLHPGNPAAGDVDLLRHPVSRGHPQPRGGGVTLGVVGSAWFGPAEEWELALRARAMDNGIFVAGAAVQGAFGGRRSTAPVSSSIRTAG